MIRIGFQQSGRASSHLTRLVVICHTLSDGKPVLELQCGGVEEFDQRRGDVTFSQVSEHAIAKDRGCSTRAVSGS